MDTDFSRITRKTPKWEDALTKPILSIKDFIDVATAKYPVGLLPKSIMPLSDIAWIKNLLPNLKREKYKNTDETENVKVTGKTFVDSISISDYLNSPVDYLLESILSIPFKNLTNLFRSFGIDVEALKDYTTNIPYKSKVIRIISVPTGCKKDDGNDCNVFHFDCILRDSLLKPDFIHLPKGLEINNYHQFSVCFPIENGFYAPDNLEVFEKRYFPRTMEELTNWRVSRNILEGVKKHIHTPKVGEPYMFNTQNVHNVAGGHPFSNRINFSVFFIYVPTLNKLFYYN